MQDEEVSRDGEVGYYPLIISFAEDCDGHQPDQENVLYNNRILSINLKTRYVRRYRVKVMKRHVEKDVLEELSLK